MKKAKWCLDCKHHTLYGIAGEHLKCAKGYKPRFYKPQVRWGDFGWKRRCDDWTKVGTQKRKELK